MAHANCDKWSKTETATKSQNFVTETKSNRGSSIGNRVAVPQPQFFCHTNGPKAYLWLCTFKNESKVLPL